MYSDFVFLDRFLFELSCKNTHTHTHTHTHTDSNEYPTKPKLCPPSYIDSVCLIPSDSSKYSYTIPTIQLKVFDKFEVLLSHGYIEIKSTRMFI